MKKGDIILLNAPFSDLSERKIRPALVLGNMMEDLLICFMSTQGTNDAPYDIPVTANRKNGLRVDSYVKCNKIFTLHASLAEMVLGSVDDEVCGKVVERIYGIMN